MKTHLLIFFARGAGYFVANLSMAAAFPWVLNAEKIPDQAAELSDPSYKAKVGRLITLTIESRFMPASQA